MVECYSPFNKTLMYYGSNSEPGAHFPFNFLFIGTFDQQSDAAKVHNMIKSWIRGMPTGMWPNWVVSRTILIEQLSIVNTYLNSNIIDGKLLCCSVR